MTQVPPGAPRPRLCHVKKNYPEQEYGFNLHAERGKGQFIGSVDVNSPADVAQLRSGDRIYAVNGASIANESHKQVVSRIKEDPLQCRLLVLDEDGEQWYRQHNIPVTHDLPNIQHCSPDHPDHLSDTDHRHSEELNHDHHYPSPPPDYGNVVVPPLEPQVSYDTPVNIGLKPRPRLCKIVKTTSQDEYGFNLHAEKHKGHFIGKVDDGSLAERAGLEQGQRIVGVRGTLIYPHTPHKEVVELIKGDPLSAELLVASPEIDHWYTQNRVEFSFDDAEIIHQSPVLSSARTQPMDSPSPVLAHAQHKDDHREEDKRSLDHATPSPVSDAHASPAPPSAYTQPAPSLPVQHNGALNGKSPSLHSSERRSSSDTSSLSTEHSHPTEHAAGLPNSTHYRKHNSGSVAYSVNQSQDSHSDRSSTHKDSPVRSTGAPQSDRNSYGEHGRSPVINGGIQRDVHPSPPAPTTHTNRPSAEGQDIFTSMSAAQLKAQLSSRKKRDPKNDQLTLQQKYEIIRNL